MNQQNARGGDLTRVAVVLKRHWYANIVRWMQAIASDDIAVQNEIAEMV
jgi:hypothetical protein